MTRFALIAAIAGFSFIISTSVQAATKANVVYCKSGFAVKDAKKCKENGGTH
jgi:hypothetical protein